MGIIPVAMVTSGNEDGRGIFNAMKPCLLHNLTLSGLMDRHIMGINGYGFVSQQYMSHAKYLVQ